MHWIFFLDHILIIKTNKIWPYLKECELKEQMQLIFIFSASYIVHASLTLFLFNLVHAFDQFK